MGPGSHPAPGADLERRIERLLESHGYRCRRNLVLRGRSGARHEVDVLAETADDLTAFRLGVECKAVSQPVEKDVVSKLAFVISDVGLHKGIVVSLRGFRLGAEQTARELGIELWGPAELERRLGRLALADLRAGPVARPGVALALRCPAGVAERLVGRERRTRLGLSGETVEWLRPLWIPHHLLELLTARREGGFLERPALKTTGRWHLYEALTGGLSRALTEPPELTEADLTPALPAAVPASRVVAAIRRAVQRRAEVVAPSARERYGRQLEALGIPPEVEAVNVLRTRLVHHPYHVALLTRRATARLVAVDGHTGRLCETTGVALTSEMGLVLEGLP